MKQLILLTLIITIFGCVSPVAPDPVIMIDGPRVLWEADGFFFIGGKVQNVSDRVIVSVEIVLHLRDARGNVLAVSKTRAYKSNLRPLETSNWDVTFRDPDGELRLRMSLRASTYEINVMDSELPT